jgi:hypothetical protein
VNQIKSHAPRRQGFSSKIDSSLDKQNGVNSPPDERGAHFQFSAFPKEFKKDHIRSSDWRFLSILSISFLVHAFAIFFLFKHLPTGDDEDFIIKIQNQFASRFLNDPSDIVRQEGTFENELLTSVSEWAQAVHEEEIFEPNEAIKGIVDVRAGDRTQKPQASSFESREQSRKSAADMRKRNLNDLREDVQSIGLLGIITSGSGLISTEIVQDILSHADTVSLNIKEKMQKVTSLQVPRPGVDYFGQGLGDDRNIYMESRNVRSQRTTVPGVNPTDLVANLTQPKEYHVQENNVYEEVSNTTVAYAGLRTRPKRKYARRTADRIKETVLGHNPAIQDCYRLELKTNPDLSGKITVRITISPAGRVTYAEIVGSTIQLPAFEYCLIEKIRRWNDFGEVDDVQGHITFRHTYVFGE